MTADDALRKEIEQAASNAVHGHPIEAGPYLGVWECVCGEPIQPVSLAAARVADAILPIVARVEQEAYRRGQAEAYERGLIQGRAASIDGVDLDLLTNPYREQP